MRWSGWRRAARRQHAVYYLALTEAAEPELTGAQQEHWLGRLEREHDNLRAALAWSLAENEQGARSKDAGAETAGPAFSVQRSRLGLRLAGSLWRFWYVHGYLSEGRDWLNQMLACRSQMVD